MAKPTSREYRIYLALWRKAFRERDSSLPDVVINTSTRNMAISIRQGMYRAISPYRNGQAFDEELRQAADLFVVYLEKPPVNATPNGPARLYLRPRVTLSELDAKLSELGLNEHDLLLSEERMAEMALSELLEDPTTQPRSTPFFKRD